MLKNQDGSVSLPASEWARLLELIENEHGWSEADLMDAIKDDGWMAEQAANPI